MVTEYVFVTAHTFQSFRVKAEQLSIIEYWWLKLHWCAGIYGTFHTVKDEKWPKLEYAEIMRQRF